MAILTNDDPQIPSWIRLDLLEEVQESGRWLDYRLELGSKDRTLVLEEHSGAIGRAALSLDAVDELERLIKLLKTTLDGTKITFEPQEPNFELSISPERLGYSVTCFIDNGNSLYQHYTWDAFGLRFFTTRSALARFLDELLAESKRFRVQPER